MKDYVEERLNEASEEILDRHNKEIDFL